MKILVAYSKSAISVIRTYEYVTAELIDNVIDLSSERGFSCTHVMVVEEQEVVYEFVRGVSPAVSKRTDVEFKSVRVVTKRDVAMVKRAWEKSLANMKCAEFLM